MPSGHGVRHHNQASVSTVAGPGACGLPIPGYGNVIPITAPRPKSCDRTERHGARVVDTADRLNVRSRSHGRRIRACDGALWPG